MTRRAHVLVLAGLILAGCGQPARSPQPQPEPESAAPTATVTPAQTIAPGPTAAHAPTPASPSASPPAPRPTPSAVPEPTTTNTLPAPPEPTRPAPSVAGRLSARSLPVPAGWRSVARSGGTEEGYLGNGTWVHARDPRYAAQDVITLGCAAVTRDDYPDPVAALEGTLSGPEGEPGVVLALDFADARSATAYFRRYSEQVRACTQPSGPVLAAVQPSSRGLVNRRTYPDGRWTEVADVRGRRATCVILSDPGRWMSGATGEQILSTLAATASD